VSSTSVANPSANSSETTTALWLTSFPRKFHTVRAKAQASKRGLRRSSATPVASYLLSMNQSIERGSVLVAHCDSVIDILSTPRQLCRHRPRVVHTPAPDATRRL